MKKFTVFAIAILMFGSAFAPAQNAAASNTAAQKPVQLNTEARPQIVNGKVVDQPLTGGLSDAINRIAASKQTAWVAYGVPVVDGEHHMCCFNARSEFRDNANCCGGCRPPNHGGGKKKTRGPHNTPPAL